MSFRPVNIYNQVLNVGAQRHICYPLQIRNFSYRKGKSTILRVFPSCLFVDEGSWSCHSKNRNIESILRRKRLQGARIHL